DYQCFINLLRRLLKEHAMQLNADRREASASKSTVLITYLFRYILLRQSVHNVEGKNKRSSDAKTRLNRVMTAFVALLTMLIFVPLSAFGCSYSCHSRKPF